MAGHMKIENNICNILNNSIIPAYTAGLNGNVRLDITLEQLCPEKVQENFNIYNIHLLLFKI